MNEDLMNLYAELVKQREELVRTLDETEDGKRTRSASVSVHMRTDDPSVGRLRREIQWRESQVIALLGGVIRYEMS